MSERTHRGYDPDAYDDTGQTTLKRDCPICGEPSVMLPYHLPCDGVEQPEGFDE